MEANESKWTVLVDATLETYDPETLPYWDVFAAIADASIDTVKRVSE